MSPPYTTTPATPGVPSKRGRIVQSANVRRSIAETVVEVRPITTNVPVDEVMGVTRGGPTPWGRVLATVVRRSFTSIRSVRMSLPSAKMAVTTEMPGADEDRSVARKLVLLSAYSTGTVTRASTSSADSPGASVCTTTYGGANSGKISRGECTAAT